MTRMSVKITSDGRYYVQYRIHAWPLAKINPFMLAGIDPLVAQRMTGWEKGETGCPSQLGLSWLGRE